VIVIVIVIVIDSFKTDYDYDYDYDYEGRAVPLTPSSLPGKNHAARIHHNTAQDRIRHLFHGERAADTVERDIEDDGLDDVERQLRRGRLSHRDAPRIAVRQLRHHLLRDIDPDAEETQPTRLVILGVDLRARRGGYIRLHHRVRELLHQQDMAQRFRRV